MLDEPTNGLDSGGIVMLGDVLRDRCDAGAAILLATHDAEFADGVADARLHLEHGQLAQPPE